MNGFVNGLYIVVLAELDTISSKTSRFSCFKIYDGLPPVSISLGVVAVNEDT